MMITLHTDVKGCQLKALANLYHQKHTKASDKKIVTDLYSPL